MIIRHMAKKYEFTEEVHPISPGLKRIRALIDIPIYGIRVGDFGGWIEGEHNLSHDGYCWVNIHAEVYSKARVLDNALVYGSAVITDAARVSGHARVFDQATVGGMAVIGGNAQIYGTAYCTGSVILCGKSVVVRGYYDQGAFSDKVVLLDNIAVIYEPPTGLLLSSNEALSLALLNDTERPTQKYG